MKRGRHNAGSSSKVQTGNSKRIDIKPKGGITNKILKKKHRSTDPTSSSSATLRWDEDIASDESDEDGDNDNMKGDDSEEDNEEEKESADQKRKRLAKEYLMSITNELDGSDDEHENNEDDFTSIENRDQIDKDTISARLRKQRLDSQGRYFRKLADNIEMLSEDDVVQRSLSGHEHAVTCVALTTDESTIYSGSKDNSLLRWDVETGQKQLIRPRWSRKTHGEKQSSDGELLSTAVTTDGRYVVSGGRDMMIKVYDSRINAEVKSFLGHRDAVTSLAFRRDTYSLFSGSLDRCLKHWDLNEMGYIETMFGHQDAVNSIDCWTKDRPISSSNDRTVRLWKISDESHLVFRGHRSNIDCVQMLMDDTYLSSGQDGSLCLWKESQKKPVSIVESTHGFESPRNPRWVTSLAAVKMSDLAVTGSFDGYLRLWNVDSEKREIKAARSIAVDGFINSIAVSSSLIVAGTGREHRLGRWWQLKGNRNKVVVLRLPSQKEDLKKNNNVVDNAYDDNNSDGDGSNGSDSEEER